jgi:two-component system, NarL family, sensor histidine kinase UhpB
MFLRARAPERVVWQDALLVACATVIMAALCVEFDFSEALRRWTAPWERFQLDELPAVLVVLAAGLTWFAARRYGEAGRELRRRRLAEAQLEAALLDNRRLSQKYVLLQEAEQKRLARELHDELGQYLNVIKLDAVAIRDGRWSDPASLRERAQAIVANGNHIHGALTALIRQLRPVGLDELGLGAALEHCVDTWRPRLAGVRLDLELPGDLADLSETLTLTLFRVVQEGLNNIAKHAHATHVTLQVHRVTSPTDVITVRIADDGVGFDAAAPTQGLGLIGMRERVAALSGRLEVQSARSGGFELVAHLPVESGPRETASVETGAVHVEPADTGMEMR